MEYKLLKNIVYVCQAGCGDGKHKIQDGEKHLLQ